MPTRSRNARTKKTSSPPHPGSSSNGTPAYPSSADATPLDSPSPALQLPTPLPEPQERILAGTSRWKGDRRVEEDATATSAWGLDAEEEDGETMPHLGTFALEEPRHIEDDAADVLGRLIDFDNSSSMPSSPPPQPSRSFERGTFLGEGYAGDDQMDHHASLSGFLNDHLDAPVDQHDLATPFYDYGRATEGQVGFEQDSISTSFGGQDGAIEAAGDIYAYAEEEPQPTTYKSPPFIEAPLPEVEDEPLPVPPPLLTKKEKKAKKKAKKASPVASQDPFEAGETAGLGIGRTDELEEREQYAGREGHVRAPMVPRYVCLFSFSFFVLSLISSFVSPCFLSFAWVSLHIPLALSFSCTSAASLLFSSLHCIAPPCLRLCSIMNPFASPGRPACEGVDLLDWLFVSFLSCLLWTRIMRFDTLLFVLVYALGSFIAASCFYDLPLPSLSRVVRSRLTPHTFTCGYTTLTSSSFFRGAVSSSWVSSFNCRSLSR